MSGLGLEFVPRLVQVDLLRTERQRLAAGTECDDVHDEYSRVERATRLVASNRQHQVVDVAVGGEDVSHSSV